MCDALDVDILSVLPSNSSVVREIKSEVVECELAQQFKDMGASKSAEFLELFAGTKVKHKKKRKMESRLGKNQTKAQKEAIYKAAR